MFYYCIQNKTVYYIYTVCIVHRIPSDAVVSALASMNGVSFDRIHLRGVFINGLSGYLVSSAGEIKCCHIVYRTAKSVYGTEATLPLLLAGGLHIEVHK